MADDFTKMKFIWLDQVLADAKVSPQAFTVAYAIATRYLNRKTGSAWPAIATLADHMHKSARRTQEAITNLIDQRHLTHRRGGTGKERKGIPSTYWIVIFDKTKASDQSADRQDETVLSARGLTGHFRPTDRMESSRLTGRNRPTNPLNEPIDEPAEVNISRKPASSPKRNSKQIDDQAFEEFWNQYPRRVSKGAARKAFDKALKKATTQDLMLGAMRYAAEREGQDPTFTKHAKTWLNGEGWLDEPTPPPESPLAKAMRENGETIRRRSLTDIAIDGGSDL